MLFSLSSLKAISRWHVPTYIIFLVAVTFSTVSTNKCLLLLLLLLLLLVVVVVVVVGAFRVVNIRRIPP